MMMRTQVPSCPDLQETRQFTLSSAGSVLVQEERLESEDYCIDRETLWYCTTRASG